MRSARTSGPSRVRCPATLRAASRTGSPPASATWTSTSTRSATRSPAPARTGTMPEHPSERPQLLVDYLESTFEIEQLLGELSEDQLEAREGPGEWSVRQIVHHLTDNEVADAMRLRQMLAHDSPLIVPFSESRFAERLHYDREIEPSVASFFALRASSGAILEQIAAEDWSREGRHEERERYSVAILVEKNIEHDRAHLGQIRRALATTGDE
ncbi:MAG: hypothetical protein F4Y69_07090 [Chloroflexi bacterium]|nr:hypothetical protein [Chloroflexota bacterium]MYF23137.1 hypothetical protein [Chloroflexota bacterium]